MCRRAPAHEVTVTWWRKEGDEFRAAMQERGRSKVGRMARLRGQVEKVETTRREPSAADHPAIGDMGTVKLAP